MTCVDDLSPFLRVKWFGYDQGGCCQARPSATRPQETRVQPTTANADNADNRCSADRAVTTNGHKLPAGSSSCTSTCKSNPAPTGDEQPGRPVRPPLVPRGFSESTRSRDHFTDREAGGLVCVLPHLLWHTARYSFPGNGTGTTPPCLRVVRRTTVSEPGLWCDHPGGRHVAGNQEDRPTPSGPGVAEEGGGWTAIVPEN